MITKDNEPIYQQKDGNYTIHVDGQTYGVCDNNPSERYTIDMVESYLAEHPEALVPEPAPPEPTPEEIAARRIAEIKAALYDIDVKTARPARLVALGRATQDDLDKLVALEDEAEALRAELRALA